MNVISLSAGDLAIAASLILMLAALSLKLQLRVEKPILIAATRTVVQLMLIGWILTQLFANATFVLVATLSLIMVLAAGREVTVRQKQPLTGWWGFGIGASTMFLSCFTVTVLSLTTMVGVDPWYSPQYAIPLLGMLLGNTMTGIAIGMDRLVQGAVDNKMAIEQRLMLGETAAAAVKDLSREAIRSALIPMVNAMAAAGLVSLPGMMTGQILAGSAPIEAVKYQIMVMFLISSATGFGAMLSVQWTCKRLFDERQRLRLDRVRTAP